MRAIKTAIGLMSGTSMDGIDAALLQTDGERHVKILGAYALPYSAAFRQKLRRGLQEAQAIKRAGERPGSLSALEEELTARHAAAVKTLLAQQGLSAAEIDIIGFHGQTVAHRPPLNRGEQGFTVQLGDGAALAQQTGIAVMADMRAADMRLGGNGAPLVPVYHYALAASLPARAFPAAFINIGGIANCTYVEDKAEPAAEALAAFDCGPGNCLIDDWAAAKGTDASGEKLLFDAGGQAGLVGAVHADLVRFYQALPIFAAGRRSYDRADFPLLQDLPQAADLSYADGAASLAFITAERIIRSLKPLPKLPKMLIISGGGAYNQAIMGNLQVLGAETGAQVKSAAELGLNSDFIEAEAWAYLAVRALYKLPLSFPATTGCAQAASGGVFYPACR